jgi:hypothetical protein
MNILNVKDKNLSIIIPFKNGHTLLQTTFIHLFKHLNIEIELENDQNKILGNSYIFVRNPIDRFFSSYHWLKFMSEVGVDIYKESINGYMKSAGVYDISSYIKNYSIFLDKCYDTHYIPQSSQILYDNKIMLKNEIIDNQINIKSLYEHKFGSNYKIIKIEEVNKIIENNTLNLVSKNIGFHRNLDTIGFNIDKFDFLDNFPNEVSFLFTTFYFYFKNLFETSSHHKHANYFREITLSEYRNICQITKNEFDFFGYGENVIDDKIFKIEYENTVIENKKFKKSLI